jgi:KipI family sensor histidine kinase inhibitor
VGARRGVEAGFRIEPLGEDALLLRLGDGIDPDVNRRVHALAAAMQRRRPPWLREIVPAYASLAIAVDTEACERDPLQAAREWLLSFDVEDEGDAQDALLPIEIPVCYGGEHGADLDDVAAHCGLTAADVAARHAGGDYAVAMLGFAPGFPYLLGLDEALAAPRLSTPRTRVPAGSVGIGGAQTGVYPREGPGGWRLIGRTPLALFDAARDPPSLLAPGRRVRFVAIDADAFARMSRRRRGGEAP